METTITLSQVALALLRRLLGREWVEVTEENRPLYRELVEAGLMYPVHTFLGGNEGYYRPTDAASDLRNAVSANSPSIPIPILLADPDQILPVSKGI